MKTLLLMMEMMDLYD